MEPVDAVVLAGGRISGFFARAAGTRVKALAPIRGRPMLAYVVEALEATPGVGRVCVVGPAAVKTASPTALWAAEGRTVLDNIRIGLEAVSGRPDRRVVLCGADVPTLEAAALDDFLHRAPPEADVCMPLVYRQEFVRAFPGSWGIYVKLREGAFTAGCQVLVRPGPFLEHLPLVERLFRLRKTQIGMASALGSGLVWKLFRGTLAVEEIEVRLSELTGCRCRGVLECRPELAFDLDVLPDLRYIERRGTSGDG